ncbi:MAG TPA: FAD-binding oxidoreductase [Xanthobacteraceae bacterium]|nr:FAD-binding oxidoreductase [Xanthobacteraceae bacterium]
MQDLTPLGNILGTRGLLTDPSDLAGYGLDWRGRFQGRPLAVIRPDNTQQLAQCLAWTYANRIAVVPQGGNTGMCGGSVPDGTGMQIIASTSRMNRIRALAPLDNAITVEAGCVLATIQDEAKRLERHFPLSLGSEGSCQIGGNISTNAGGTEVLRYGPMRDLVLGLEAVLPDGRVVEGLHTLRKNNAGYDLKHLFIGSEGTLGIVTAAVLKLFPKARSSATALCGLSGLDAALTLLERCNQALGPALGNFEVMDRGQIRLVQKHTALRLPMKEPHNWYVLIGVADPAPDAGIGELLEDILAAALDDGLLADVLIAQSEAQAQLFWAIRHEVSDANRAAGMVLSHDTAVPTSRTADFIREVDTALRGLEGGAFPVYVGHLGDGNIHVAVIFPRDLFSKARFEELSSEVSDHVYRISHAMGGSISAEHGIGQTLPRKLSAYKDPVQIELMRTLKAALDPRGLMNPGKVLITS